MQILFARYLAGECTPEETQRVLDYFVRKGDEKDIRELIRQEFEKEVPVSEVTIQTVADLHKNFAQVMEEKQPKRFWMLRPGMAATWLILMVGLGILFLMYRYRTEIQQEGYSTIATRSGERKKIELTDGTVIWLNAASKLRYPDNFASDLREVTLEGEAFFDVARDSSRPFVIRSGDLTTTVLGTSFNVRAYQEDPTLSVAVVTGKVKVAAPELREEMQLIPDQQAVFDKKERLLNKNERVSAAGLASWKEGLFQFRNTTFSEVTAVLQRSYGVHITYDPLLENCPIILADFDERDSVDAILKTLMSSVNGKVQKTAKDEYHLKGTVACQP